MSERKKKLKEALQKLDHYKRNLNSKNISDFENLIQDVQSLLSENHKARFSKLTFFEEEMDFDNMNDDLPF